MRRAWTRTGGEVRRNGRLGRNLAAIGACIGILTGTISVSLVSASSAYAAVVVTVPCTGVGGGAAGLIAAINTANPGGGGTINLAPGCTYNLTTPNNTQVGEGSNGLPVISSTITINGNNATIAANDTTFRVLEVGSPGSLTLNGLTVTGGNTGSASVSNIAAGGGILVVPQAALTLNASRVTRNTTSAPGHFQLGGGGIFNQGTLTLIASQVTDNTSNNPAIAFGGGIAQQGGTLTMTTSLVSGNHASASGTPGGSGGGGMFIIGSATLNSSLVIDNTANSPVGDTAGGGIESGPSGLGMLTMNSSLVIDNTASSLNGNAFGGGIFNGGPANLSFSPVVGNRATGRTAAGGGIFNEAPLGMTTLFFSPVVGNVPNNCRPLRSVPGCID